MKYSIDSVAGVIMNAIMMPGNNAGLIAKGNNSFFWLFVTANGGNDKSEHMSRFI